MPGMLKIRKLADKSSGTRIKQYHPYSGQSILVNPETPGNEHEPWPFLGIKIEGELPEETAVSTTFVDRGIAEGWLKLENPRIVHEAGGPSNNPWTVTHTFKQADAVVLDTVDGEIRYVVRTQPGKWDDANEPSGKRVDWFYGLELEH